MIRHLRLAILVVALWGPASVLHAATTGPDPQAILTEAEDLFAQANEAALSDPAEATRLYTTAAQHYGWLANPGPGQAGIVNGELEINLANTHFLAGDLGRAILHYRRAERLRPGDRALRESLAHARSQRIDSWPDSTGRKWWEFAFFWHYFLGPNTRAILFAIAFATLWALLFLAYARQDRRVISWAGMAGIVALLLGGSILLHRAAPLPPRPRRRDHRPGNHRPQRQRIRLRTRLQQSPPRRNRTPDPRDPGRLEPRPPPRIPASLDPPKGPQPGRSGNVAELAKVPAHSGCGPNLPERHPLPSAVYVSLRR